MRLLFALALLIFAAPATGADLAGPARIIDGDTIEISDQRIRLYGIDAPEGRQTCESHGTPYPYGTMATAWLVNMTLGKPVACQQKARDKYKRVVAVCHADGVNLNDSIVRAGWAMAYRQFSREYVPAENEAKAAKRGLWAGAFPAPWEWRRARPR